jgi:hypothetical protein
MDAHDDLEALAARVDHVVADVLGLDEGSRGRALALKEAIEAFHRLGLTTIVRRLKGDPRGRELLYELVDDPGVRALFLMHGVVKPPPVPEPPTDADGMPLDLVQISLPLVKASP